MPARSKSPLEFEIGGLDIREVGGCTCLRLRKASRRVTQLYEACLEPAGLTIGQFGVLAHLFASAARGEDGCPVGTMADRLGVDPTTLKRTLAPLVGGALVAVSPAPYDRRIRLLGQTEAGRARLAAAVPLWRKAQGRLETAVGGELKGTLDRAIDAAYATMSGAPHWP